MNFYDDPKFQQVAFEATRRARVTGEQQRIFKAYGVYCIRPATAAYDGEHVSFVSAHAYKLPGDYMSTKHKPATPLPWKVTPFAGGIEGANNIELVRMGWPRRSIARQIVEGEDPRRRVGARIISDAAYIAHAANAYPKLVAALRKHARCEDAGDEVAALLKELGEE